MLAIHEKLFLLALDEEKGCYLPFVKKTLAYGLSGGILAELAFSGKVCSNEKHRLEIMDAGPTSDPVLDDAFQEILASEKARKVSYWISQITARPKKLRKQVGNQLVEKSMLAQDEDCYYWKPPGEGETGEVTTKYELKNPLRATIFTNIESDNRELALLSVASAAGLLNLIFTQDELEIAQQRMREKIVRSALGNPVMQTIEEIEQGIHTSMDIDLD